LYATAFGLVAATLLWTVAIPGVVAYRDGVFVEAGTRARIDDTSVVARLHAFDNVRRQIGSAQEALSRSITSALITPGTSEAVPAPRAGGVAAGEAGQVREYLRATLEDARPRLRVSGFVDNETTVYWTVSYLALGALVLAACAPVAPLLRQTRTWLAGAGAYVLMMAPNWYRNTSAGQAGRTVYSYVNLDISPASFALQELRMFGLFLLLSVVWSAAVRGVERARYEARDALTSAPGADALAPAAADARGAFLQWQRDSVLLAAVFLPWTRFYWRSVVALGDSRYVTSAIVMHLAWLVTWLAASAPLLVYVRAWSTTRTSTLLRAAHQDPGGLNVEHTAKLLSEIEPLPRQQVLLASAASVASFVWPLLDLIRR
jgi:hypothetical protein